MAGIHTRRIYAKKEKVNKVKEAVQSLGRPDITYKEFLKYCGGHKLMCDVTFYQIRKHLLNPSKKEEVQRRNYIRKTPKPLYQTIGILTIDNNDVLETLKQTFSIINEACNLRLEICFLANGTIELRRTQR